MIINKQHKAEQDLIDIWLYTFREWDDVQADKYLDQIENSLLKLVEHPKLGMDCGHVRKGYRRLQVLHHRVYYYVTRDSIEIVRILHERMDEHHNL